MDRRTALAIGATVAGSVLVGCIDSVPAEYDPTDGAVDDQDDSDMTDSGSNDSSTDGDGDGTDDSDMNTSDDDPDLGTGIGETTFQLVDEHSDADPSASVTVEDGTVTISGIITGNNACYTARLDQAVIEDDTLIVNIESYEDADEGMGCASVIVYIEYEATIEVEGDSPESVRVEHNQEEVTTG